MTDKDPYNLKRFIEAQDPIIDEVCAELRRGAKTGHWMWFVFPQIRGLGSSPTAVEFAVGSKAEAEAYLRHPILSSRLEECIRLVLAVEGRSIDEIFGYPDHLKFWSSMTLFALAAPDRQLFRSALGKYFDGKLDRQTVQRL